MQRRVESFMNDVSFIISVDSSFEMTNNFFEQFINDDFVKLSEVIIINDCIDNIRTLNYLNQLKNNNSNVKLNTLETKVGYGKANNVGVDISSGKYLFFINTDIFAENGCFEKMLDSLNKDEADCVQPLLIWPQNNRIQCAGSFFGPYYKNHLFAGRRPESLDFSKIPNSRQALTSALYAMKRELFYEFGKFDEFYYNKLESFELSFKLSLNGKRCKCLYSAIAYHSQGGGRNQYYFDFYQQEAYFWSNMGRKIVPDITNFYKYQLTEEMQEKTYNVIAITQTRGVKELISELNIQICSYTEINGINPNRINLYDLVPYSTRKTSIPILFFVENITNLCGNIKWFSERGVHDIVMDTYGNLLYTSCI